MKKINGNERISLPQLKDYRENSGITDRQYKIIKRKFYDADQPNVLMICTELHISESTYRRELNKALSQIYKYSLPT